MSKSRCSKTFAMKDPCQPHSFICSIEAKSEEDAISIIARRNFNYDGEPDWEYARSFVYEEE